VPWKFVAFFFNKVLISGLILLGQGDKPKKTENMFRFVYTNIFVDETLGLSRILATIVNLPNIAGALNNSENVGYVGHNSEPRH